MKFGSVRLMRDDFKGASEFYDKVIDINPVGPHSLTTTEPIARYTWRVMVTSDVRLMTWKLHCVNWKLIKNKLCFLKFTSMLSTLSERYKASIKDEITNTTLYYIIMECQLLHHIDTEIIETLVKLKTIDTMKREVSIVRRDILESIPDVDCRTEQMLQEYRQMGLLFIYNIDEKPKFAT